MTEATSADRPLDVDSAFDLLSEARRRGVLYALDRNARTNVDTLAARISRWEADDGKTSTDDDVRTMLVHSHLPKLADADVVTYDHESGVVEATEKTAELEPLLRCTRERDPSLPRIGVSHAPKWVSETGD